MKQTSSEHDLIQRIRKDAEQIPVPDSLKPEQIAEKLNKAGSGAQDTSRRRKPAPLRRLLPLGRKRLGAANGR